MLNLFTLDEDWRVVIKPETLKLKPFKAVMDKYTDREIGINELTLVYFMADWRSDFDDIVDLNRRQAEILNSLADSDKIKVDVITEKAIEFYNERQPSISLHHLNSMKKALHSLQKSMDSIDLEMQVTDAITGELKPVYDTMDLNRITGMIEKSPKLIAALKEVEKQVKIELQENTSHRGSGEKSIYEDG